MFLFFIMANSTFYHDPAMLRGLQTPVHSQGTPAEIMGYQVWFSILRAFQQLIIGEVGFLTVIGFVLIHPSVKAFGVVVRISSFFILDMQVAFYTISACTVPKLAWPRPMQASAWGKQCVDPYWAMMQHPGKTHRPVLSSSLVECPQWSHGETFGLAAPYSRAWIHCFAGVLMVQIGSMAADLQEVPWPIRFLFVVELYVVLQTYGYWGSSFLQINDGLVTGGVVYKIFVVIWAIGGKFMQVGFQVAAIDNVLGALSFLVQRQGGRAGLAERCAEHHKALLAKCGRDGELPRYRALRQSLWSEAFLPISQTKNGGCSSHSGAHDYQYGVPSV